ncbi:membrane protein insertase YidC [Chitinophaga sedimenti]|uniref:membrane protein insertase YidC n=1 Tax=Chitinophaga sedimenti TaxID=2033606 RepID=UPI00200428D6|nr:membrane protein insertase YidC [Chitinophaga sedimenti]MCK7557061.1 membrane protein insertase YidC [Chitinophaga sedimenti]
MDRNSIIGFLLLGALLVGYIVYNNKTQVAAQKEKHRKDSIEALNRPKEVKAQTVVDSAGHVVAADSAALAADFGVLANAAVGTEQVQVLENELVRIELTNKGGQPKLVRVKSFKGEGVKATKQFLSSDGQPLDLQSGSYNRLSLTLPLNGKPVNTGDLYFAGSQISTDANGSQVVTYRLNTTNPAQYLEYIYTLPKDSYVVNFNIRAVGMQQLIAGNTIPLQWNSRMTKQEHDMQSERMNNQVHYRTTDKSHDYFTLQNKSHEKLDKLQWISFKQQFFNITLMPKKEFAAADITTSVPQSANVVGEQMSTLSLPYDHAAEYSFPIDIYYGPNHYKTLKSFDNGLESIIPLGSGIFAFVKYVNKWVIIPVFNFLSGSIGNYGLIIILLTLFIRLLILPFTYQSYVSQAKMKVLKPELDELRAKYADDQQKFGMEQMNLFRSAGVSPLGGCLPALLQLPILVAMYSFFPSSIELRQESFLWAKDLSTYDSILNIGFQIPLYGDHVSLFTLLMTITSLILAFYNRGMTDQSNPVMKYMPYVFPIMLLGIFNKLAAALTFYYFLSNVISILLQFSLQKFVINHAKIHAQIEENKKKPKTQSKWAEKLAEMQKAQQQQQRKNNYHIYFEEGSFNGSLLYFYRIRKTVIMLRKTGFALLLAAMYTGAAFGQDYQPSAQRIKSHVTYLASEKLKGRGTAEKGSRKASAWVAKQFKALGLQPGNAGSYFRGFYI